MRDEFFNCDCHDLRHLIRVSIEDWENDSIPKYLMISQQMSHYLPWNKRIKVALDYIFGRVTEQCHYTDTLLTLNDAKRLQQCIESFIEEEEARKSKEDP